jgi:hypothetical protein
MSCKSVGCEARIKKTTGGKRDHQNGDHRQEREVGNCRTKLIAKAVVKAFGGTQQVSYHRLALNFSGNPGDFFQRHHIVIPYFVHQTQSIAC